MHKIFRAKLCQNCAFPKNFHTRKLGEITVFYAVISNDINTLRVLQFQDEFSLSQFILERFTSPHILDRRKY